MASKSEISSFLGLTNIKDPVRVGLRGLVRADNVLITQTAQLVRREGVELLASGQFLSLFSTADEGRCFAQTTDGIVTVNDSAQPLFAAPSAHPLSWAELGKDVLFANDEASGLITENDTFLPWRWPVPGQPTMTLDAGDLPAGQYQAAMTWLLPGGRETGPSARVALAAPAGSAITITPPAPPAGLRARIYVTAADSTALLRLGETDGAALAFTAGPDQLGAELTTEHCYPLPAGVDVLGAHKGRVYAGAHMPAQQQSVVYASRPLTPHLWVPTDFFMVPGRIRALADGGDALLVCTDQQVLAYRGGDARSLTELARYGVPPGLTATHDGDDLLVWTLRGLCRYAGGALTPITAAHVSVPPGVAVGSCLMHSRGQTHALVCTRRGDSKAFNPWKPARSTP